jgi:hypothetical protein
MVPVQKGSPNGSGAERINHCCGSSWIRRIHMFLGLPDPDPLVRGMDLDPALDPDPDPSIIMQK